MLYQWDVGGGSVDKVVGDYFGRLAHDEPQPVDPFAERLFRGVASEVDRLDEIIRQHAKGWSPERMSKLVRHVLRLAISELRSARTPQRVVIDEALEIGKRFAGENSTSFLNGVLESVRKEIHGNKDSAPATAKRVDPVG